MAYFFSSMPQTDKANRAAEETPQKNSLAKSFVFHLGHEKKYFGLKK
jgi:hypothetical protein